MENIACRLKIRIALPVQIHLKTKREFLVFEYKTRNSPYINYQTMSESYIAQVMNHLCTRNVLGMLDSEQLTRFVMTVFYDMI
jgi:hypothetical protein